MKRQPNSLWIPLHIGLLNGNREVKAKSYARVMLRREWFKRARPPDGKMAWINRIAIQFPESVESWGRVTQIAFFQGEARVGKIPIPAERRAIITPGMRLGFMPGRLVLTAEFFTK